MTPEHTPVDPFALAENITPVQKTNAHVMPDFKAIPPADMGRIVEMGQRASRIIAAQAAANPDKHIIPPHPLHCAVEIACTHLSRGLDLRAMYHADDLTFAAEYVTIAANIDRVRRTFPAHVGLHFQRSPR